MLFEWINPIIKPLTILLVVILCVARTAPAAGQGAEGPDAEQIRFSDWTAQSGIDFVHHDGGTGQQMLYELMAAGLATFDYDNDGRIDCYFLSSSRSADGAGADRDVLTAGCQLYRNLGDLQFARVTRSGGIGLAATCLGVAVCDFDNDGFQDVFVNNFGHNAFFVNNGDGTFTSAGQASGLAAEAEFGAGATWLDVDQDGDADLYCGNYVEFTEQRYRQVAPGAYPFPPGPKDFPPASDRLWMNLGDGTFEDHSVASGVSAVASPTMGVVSGDFDGDGDPDIFLCSDGAPNVLLRNEGGKFVDDALLAGVAYDVAGRANGSMGVDAADVNYDGLPDLLVTDYSNQLPMLFMSSPGGWYEDASRATQIGAGVLPHVNWGAVWADFDNDSDSDAFIANGHFLRDDQVKATGTGYAVRNTLMLADGRRFRDITSTACEGVVEVGSSRGCAAEDFDGDGDIDLLVLNCNAAPQLLRNDLRAKGNWFTLELRGRACNRSAAGAQVRVGAEPRQRTFEVHHGRGYQSHYGTRIHFGIAAGEKPVATVVWPDGSQQSVDLRTTEQFRVVVQDAGLK